MAKANNFTPIDEIKQYKLIARLGTGGMGEVYEGFDTVLERKVAVKLMHAHLQEDGDNQRRFMQEARLLAKSVHPNIVTIHEIGKIDSFQYIVMEYVNGKSLTKFLKLKGALDVPLALKIAEQLLSGLHHAHKMGILHLDIKSENALITSENHVKILDFGIARMINRGEILQEENIAGTLHYMAPEQLLGEAIDHRCDLFAAGVVLYQMLTNKLPFGGDTPAALLYDQLNEDPISPSYYNDEVTRTFAEVVLKAIHRNKESRWQSAKEFSEALAVAHQRGSAARELEDYLSGEAPGTDELENILESWQQIFIGRDKELKKLVNVYKQTQRNKGQTVILMGEAGIGKSTLAEKFTNYARKHGAWVLYGACLYQEGTDAYLPFIDVLRVFFSKQRHTLPENQWLELRDEILAQAPSLLEFGERFTTHFGKPDKSTNRQTNQAGLNLHDGIRQFLTILSETQPVILILDDIQWADEASLRLFHHLTRFVADHPILLIGISRTDRYDLQQNGKAGPLVDTLARIRREGNYVQIDLGRFDQENCSRLIDQLFSPNLFTKEFYALVYHETKGNPFFLTETLKQAREEGIISKEKQEWTNKEANVKLAVPGRIEDIFVRRLSGLDETEHEILQVAAVQGYKFDAAILARLLELTRIKLLKYLQRMEKDLQIIISHEKEFQFEHPMLRDLLYNEIPSALRKEYHLLIAEELKAMHGPELGSFAGDLALHLRRGESHSEAAPWLYEAAVRACGLNAFREASLYLEDFLDSVAACDGQLPESVSEHELYAHLGESYEESGQLQKSVTAREKQLALAEQSKDTSAQAETLLTLGRLQGKLSQWEAAYKSYESCLKIVTEFNLPGVLGRALNNIGLIDFHQSKLQEAATRFQETLDSEDSLCGLTEKAHASTNLGIIASITGSFDEAMRWYQQALVLYERQDHSESDQASIHHNMGATLMDLKRWDDALLAFDKCLAVTEEVDDRSLQALTRMNIGKTLAKQNKALKRARACTEKALKFFKRTNDRLNIAEVYHIWGLIYLASGEYRNATRNLERSLGINEHLDYQEGVAETCMTLGEMYMKRGHGDQATEYLERALDLCKSLHLDARTQEIQSMLTEVNQIVVKVVDPPRSIA